MTKQEAREILVKEAKAFKRMGLSSKQFVSMLEDADVKMNINSPIIQAYLLIESELTHIVAITWGWDRT